MIKINGKIITIGKFPNNEIRLQNLKEFTILDNIMVEFKYESSDDLMALIFLKKYFDEFNLNPNLFIWYMPYSRMDRGFENDLFLLKYVSEIINDLNLGKVYVLEPHSKVTEELLKNINPIYPMPELLEYVKKDVDFGSNDNIVFPDNGSYERYDLNYSNSILFEKKRDENSTKVKESYLKSGVVNIGGKCIIIDDLCASGETCVRVGNILKEKGAKKVYVLTVHTEDQALDHTILSNYSPIDLIYTTNSLFTKKHEKVKILTFGTDDYLQIKKR